MHLTLLVSDTNSTLNRPQLLTSTHSRHKTSWMTMFWPETSISNNNNRWGEQIMITCSLNLIRCRLFSIRIWVINLSLLVLINFLNTIRILILPLLEAGLVAMSITERRTLMHIKISSKCMRFTLSNRHSKDTAKNHQYIHILTCLAEFKILTK
jgi:hypothetical protein